jgi:hypothetical protein
MHGRRWAGVKSSVVRNLGGKSLCKRNVVKEEREGQNTVTDEGGEVVGDCRSRFGAVGCGRELFSVA